MRGVFKSLLCIKGLTIKPLCTLIIEKWGRVFVDLNGERASKSCVSVDIKDFGP